eukprot:TRINITY_DN4359_c0_g1_i1.p1 TRINITY_DN4359_c0_g1~~TRINITY_DN4359_c0_g1_i1.p1  ORF type:complete len:480 (-),score=65.38 TRINITY_DN4359_c0_g1_i1:4-1443(-)
MSLDCSGCRQKLPRSAFTNAQVKVLKVARRCKACQSIPIPQQLPSSPTKGTLGRRPTNTIQIKCFDNCGILHGDILDRICGFLYRYPFTLLNMSQVCTMWQKTTLDETLWKSVLNTRTWQLGIPIATSNREKYKAKFIEDTLWLRSKPTEEPIKDLEISPIFLVSVTKSNYVYAVLNNEMILINPEAPMDIKKIQTSVEMWSDSYLYSDPYFIFLTRHLKISIWNKRESKGMKLPLLYEMNARAFLHSHYLSLTTPTKVDVWDLEKKRVVLSLQLQKLHSVTNDSRWYWLSYTQDNTSFLKGIEIGESMREHTIVVPRGMQIWWAGDRLYCYDEGYLIIKHISWDLKENIELLDWRSPIICSDFSCPNMQLELEHNLVLLWEDNIFNVVDLEKRKTILQVPVTCIINILHCDRLKVVYTTRENDEYWVVVWNIKRGSIIGRFKTYSKYSVAFKDNYLLTTRQTNSTSHRIWRYYYPHLQ